MATNLNYTVEQINRMLYLIDENKNLLPYPYETPLPNGLTDVGDGSILTLERDGTYSNESFILSSKCILPAGEYTVSLDITSILEELAISSNFELKIETGNGKEITTTNSCKTFNLTENTAVIVSLIVPASFVAGLLIKPQIEKGGAKTTWVPNMDKIGTYVDRRFNGLNTKIKVLTDLVESSPSDAPSSTPETPETPPTESDSPCVAVECTAIGAEGLEAGQFRVDVVVSNNPGITGYQFDLVFDNTKVQVVDAVREYDEDAEEMKIVSAFPVTPTLSIDKPTYNPATADRVSANASRAKTSTKNGVYLSIIFKVVGNFEQSVLTLDDVLFCNNSADTVSFKIGSGIINKASVMYGDLNGDGEINSIDAVTLAQVIAGWDVEYNKSAADCNGDGDINSIDAVLLAQYIAGWDVYLGLPSRGLKYQLYQDGETKTCTITGIGDCTDQKVNIPKQILGYTVVGITDKAFENCTSLTEIAIPASVTSIGNSAFSGCSKLEKIICQFAENKVAGVPWGAADATTVIYSN